jgi:integrase
MVAEFLDYVRYERGLSPNTVTAYGRDLAAFTKSLTAVGTAPGVATADDVRAYFAGSGGDGASSSVARRTAAVRSFYAYLVREGVREDDPAALLRTPKRPQDLPRVLSVDEVEDILAAVVPAGPLGQRDLGRLSRERDPVAADVDVRVEGLLDETEVLIAGPEQADHVDAVERLRLFRQPRTQLPPRQVV